MDTCLNVGQGADLVHHSAGTPPGRISTQDAIDAGHIRSGSTTESILRGIEAEFMASPPCTSIEAFELIDRATARFGLAPGVNMAGRVVAGQDATLINVGGITTTLKANGEIVIERGGNVILHLLPPSSSHVP
jgi:hypothetical protein